MTIRYRNELNYTHAIHEKQNEHQITKFIIKCIDMHGVTSTDSAGYVTVSVNLPQEVCARCDYYSPCNRGRGGLSRRKRHEM